MFVITLAKSAPGRTWSTIARIASKPKGYFLAADVYLDPYEKVALRATMAMVQRGTSGPLVAAFGTLWRAFERNQAVRWEGMPKRQGLRDFLDEHAQSRVAVTQKRAVEADRPVDPAKPTGFSIRLLDRATSASEPDFLVQVTPFRAEKAAITLRIAASKGGLKMHAGSRNEALPAGVLTKAEAAVAQAWQRDGVVWLEGQWYGNGVAPSTRVRFRSFVESRFVVTPKRQRAQPVAVHA